MIFDLKECARWAEVRPETFRKWIERGEILVMKYGSKSWLSAEELSLCLWAKNPIAAPSFDAQYHVRYGE